jgi:hypothetical protein
MGGKRLLDDRRNASPDHMADRRKSIRLAVENYQKGRTGSHPFGHNFRFLFTFPPPSPY